MPLHANSPGKKQRVIDSLTVCALHYFHNPNLNQTISSLLDSTKVFKMIIQHRSENDQNQYQIGALVPPN